MAALLAVLVVSSGCGPGRKRSASRDGSGQRVIRLAFSRIEQADLDLVKRQAARFAAAHPGIKVEVIAQAWRSTDIHDLYARFLALRDPAIDVYILDDPWVAEFAFGRWIRPLPELEGWARRKLHPAGLRTGIYEGKLYGVPFELSANALFYRKDLLEQAGLKPPTSLDELLTQAETLKERFGLARGLVLHANFVHNDIYPFLWAEGGGVLDLQGRIQLDAPVNRRVLARLAGAFAQGRAVPSGAEMRRLGDPVQHGYHDAVAEFGNGQAAFMVNWLRFAVVADDPRSPVRGRVGVMPVPGRAGRGGGSTLGSWYLTVNAASREPALAMELIRYLSRPDQEWERYQQLATMPPHRRFFEDPTRLAAHPRLKAAGDVLTHARSRLPLPNERALNEIAERALREILFDGRAVDPTLVAAAQAMRQAVADFPRSAPGFPPRRPDPPSPPLIAARHLLIGLGALWAIAVLLGLAYALADRRRALFRTLAWRFACPGLASTLLALVTGMILSLVVLVRSQEDAIGEAQAIFRTSILEHSRSTGRQIAVGASLVREAVDGAKRQAAAGGRAGSALAGLESLYIQSLDVLTAEGSYSDDIIFLQVIRADGTVVSDEADFLDRQLVRGHAVGRPTPDPELRRLARYSRSLTLRDVPEGKRPAHVEVLVPLIEGGRHAGIVRVGYSKARQNQRLKALQTRQERLLRRGVLLVVGFAGALVLFGALLLVLVARSVSGPLVKLQELSERIGGGDLTVRCEVLGRDEVAALGCHMNQMVEGLVERERIRETFGKFLGPNVSEVLLAGKVELGGEERTVTVLFSDLRGFTSISERLSPERVVHLLNVYFEHMVEAVFENDGMLDKFMGDGMMAVFGAPQPDPEHPLKAVRAALAMRTRLAEVNRQLEAEGLPTLQLGVGLHTGPAVLGNIGSSRRMEYTVIGDAVNLASRLEGTTKQFGVDVVMSGSTHEAVGAQVASSPLGPVQVKGKSLFVEVFSVEGLREKT